MGEVYKARDMRLDRTVAVKVLPAAHAADQERRQRFEREARAISSLSHPHICALYDIGDTDGVQFLVMELLEGETLEKRLAQGPLPVEQALRHAIEIAAALDQAHRHGVIHRDLKPANVMLTRNGVKLLDFGLAKMHQPRAAGATSLLTVSQSLTTAGTIVGTFQYMAPEQLEGAESDARSDIFAFGAVLYEMVTGEKAFQAKSQAGLISAIISAEPRALSTLQPLVPPMLEHVIKTCLAKDPQERWQTAHDVLVQLKWIAGASSQAGAPSVVARRTTRERIASVAGAALLVVLAALSWIHFSEPRATPRLTRFIIPQPDGFSYSPNVPPAVSPDGQSVAMNGLYGPGQQAIWLRRMGSLEASRLAGTEGAGILFWSTDGRSLVFFAAGKMLKMDVAGGPPEALASTPLALGGSQNGAGLIVFGGSAAFPAIRSVSGSGGAVNVVLAPDSARKESMLGWPSFLPDGRHFLYHAISNDNAQSGIRIGSIDSNQTLPLISGTGPAFYVPEGYVLFTRQNTAFALPFDADKLRATGEAVAVTSGVGPLIGPPGSMLSVSQAGVLAYRSTSSGDTQVTSYDRAGTRLGDVSNPGPYRQAALSPDGTRLVLERLDRATNTWDLWLLDVASRIESRLTFDPADDTDPVWSPDSRQIAFASFRHGHLDIYRKVIGTSKDEVVYADAERKVPEWWLKDGSILYTMNNGKDYYLIVPEGERKPRLIFHADFSTDEPSVSPDGRWIAFSSLESGRAEIYVAAFPAFTDKRQVSNNAGVQPRWRADGNELYYLSLDNRMMVVDTRTGSSQKTSVPRQLFAERGRPAGFYYDNYGVTADGKRFLVLETVEEGPAPISVIVDWPALLPPRR
jgi:serine/threonine protein kinase